MIVLGLLGLLSSTLAMSLLDLHNDQLQLRTLASDNVLKNEDGTISLTEYADVDYDEKPPVKSNSIPLMEASVAMSNPIWKIFSRASDFYRILRRTPSSSSDSEHFAKKQNPRGWQLFLK
uniref:Uncharacterized protein n=1 Tax=Panagrolaimus sp. JU765 TaxID=591449 RepID=A0AC34QSU7_9BILA